MQATPAVLKYLERYAEPEARLAESLPGPYHSALVVPVLGESVQVLNRMGAAFAHTEGRGLLILVVNANDATSPEHQRENQALLEALAAHPERHTVQAVPRVERFAYPRYDLLLLDRASPGSRLGVKEGVGRARRIGCDLALALAARGALRSLGVGCSDADACLPHDYFSVAEAALVGASAVLFPFRHRPSGEAELDAATRAYELSLRYYVLGLAHAGSPYAFHSVGSTLYLDLNSYGQARGFSNRQAGEDFYLLNKLVKLAPLRRVQAPSIEIQARRSSRVPFGTGPGVARLLESSGSAGGLTLYNPAVFDALRSWLETLEAYALDPTLSIEAGPLRELDPTESRPILEHLEAIGASASLIEAAAETRSAVQLRRRLHTWFDGFRTLKFVHAIRDAGHPDLSFRAAIERAPFLAGAPPFIDQTLAFATRAEADLPERVGLGLL